MPSWSEFEQAQPEFAALAREFFDARVHKTLATLRADGRPRISGIECYFVEGELAIGSMWQARKALDLQRDPRLALHSGSDDPPGWRGDAKLSGRAEEVVEGDAIADFYAAIGQAPAGRSHVFRIEVEEVSVVCLPEPPDHLIIQTWTPEGGLRETERK